MKTLGYYNGKIDEIERMTVPMNDRASWFGDGVYDAQMCRNGHIFGLDEHVERFFGNAQALRIEMPVDREGLKALLKDLVARMDTGDLFVYYQVTRGGGPREHSFPAGKGNLWVTLTPRKVNDGLQPIRLITVEDTRFFHCNLKTLNLIPSVMASQRAKEAGCQESVFYRPGGRVTEGSHSNVHIIRDGCLYTAPTDNLILPGLARKHLLALCRGELNIPVREEAFTLEDLFGADEVLITSSSALIRRGCEIDGKPVGCRCPELYARIRGAVMSEYERETR